MILQLENPYKTTHYIDRLMFVEDPEMEHNARKMRTGLILRVKRTETDLQWKALQRRKKDEHKEPCWAVYPDRRQLTNQRKTIHTRDAANLGRNVGISPTEWKVLTVKSKLREHSTTRQTVQSDGGVRVPVPQEDSLMKIQHRCTAPAGLQVTHDHWENRTEDKQK